jgi:hypothetical protein
MARAMGKRNTETQQAPPGATEIPISVGAETSIHCGTYVSSLPGLRVYCGGAGSQGWHPGLSRRAGSARAFALAYQYVQKRATNQEECPELHFYVAHPHKESLNWEFGLLHVNLLIPDSS